ncbi:MAG TPA: adenylate/guanylate cyclase domain-containing protein [Gaiellaceae bacterium]|nr:adenylate/guanylate cyclase domain-containing protein [Gaiellaceae bacterium]
MRRRAWLVAALLVLPVALVLVLRLRPSFDGTWENHPAHFWLVLGAALFNVGLGIAVFGAARARGDARLLLVSLAFIAAAGFLALHALATPGVLLDQSTPGFLLANPIGLVVAGAFMALSPWRWSREASARLVARSRLLLGALLAVLGVWAIVSVLELPPLDRSLKEPDAEGALWAIGLVGIPLYGIAAIGYLRLYRQRRAVLVLGVTVACTLLAEAMLVVAVAANWRASWWEWHVLMVLAFGFIAYAAWREWPIERFAHLYLDQTLATSQELTLLFADLEGYTSFAERNGAGTTARMLDVYWDRLLPLLQEHGADVRELIGDEVMAVFGGDDHASRGARAALAFQDEAAKLREAGWPQFRAGVNSGVVVAGVLARGTPGQKRGVVGDTVNVASRLQSAAPVGRVLASEATVRRLPAGAVAERVPPLRLKGKSEVVDAYLLHTVPERR